MYFVCTWAAFAFSLYWLNRMHGRRVFDTIPFWEDALVWKFGVIGGKGNDAEGKPLGGFAIGVNWKACVLFLCGFVGGIFSAISGRYGAAPYVRAPRLSLVGG